MEILEIINRRSPAVYTIDELQFALEKYIHKKKGVEVKINIFKGMPEDGILNQNQIMHMHRQHSELLLAFKDVQENYQK